LHHALRGLPAPGFKERYLLPAVVIGEPRWGATTDTTMTSRPLLIDGSRVNRVGVRHLTAWSTRGKPRESDWDVTGEMLDQALGVSSKSAPEGDPLFDAFGALSKRYSSDWHGEDNVFATRAKLAVRLLIAGAPIVCLSAGGFDTHSNEVVGPLARYPQTVQTVLLARTLAGLAFALKGLADPCETGKSMWDSTLVLVCSEFGRTAGRAYAHGFNSPLGPCGGGSDHAGKSAMLLLGGPLRRGGRLMTSGSRGGAHDQARVLATIARSLGVNPGFHSSLEAWNKPVIEDLTS
jgi:hypothetical protein